MSEPQAFLSTVLYNPATKQADQAVVVVQYGPKEARVRIELPPIAVDSPNLVDELPQLLHELGEALRHIKDAPLFYIRCIIFEPKRALSHICH